MSPHAAALPFALALLGCLSACNTPSKTPPPASTPNLTACASYAAKLCAETGEGSQTCASVRTTLELLPPAACATGMEDLAFSKAKLGEAAKKCDELITKLCADLGAQTQTCELVKLQTERFSSERCALMLEHYGEVIADLKKIEARNQPLTPKQMAATTAPGAPSFGPTDAKVTIVEFSDFECPFCSRAADAARQIKEKYGDRVHFVFRQFPLDFHPNAHLAAQAALAAHAQGKFWEMHDRMFADQRKLDRASLEESAEAIGLDLVAFKKALDDAAHVDAVNADFALGESVSVSGTPAMFLNGKRILDATSFEAIAKHIDAALDDG